MWRLIVCREWSQAANQSRHKSRAHSWRGALPPRTPYGKYFVFSIITLYYWVCCICLCCDASSSTEDVNIRRHVIIRYTSSTNCCDNTNYDITSPMLLNDGSRRVNCSIVLAGRCDARWTSCGKLWNQSGRSLRDRLVWPTWPRPRRVWPTVYIAQRRAGRDSERDSERGCEMAMRRTSSFDDVEDVVVLDA